MSPASCGLKLKIKSASLFIVSIIEYNRIHNAHLAQNILLSKNKLHYHLSYKCFTVS
jgi:hypothetical protein